MNRVWLQKRTEVLTHAITQLKFKKHSLTEARHKSPCVIWPPFICNVQNGQICTDLEYSSRYQKLQILGVVTWGSTAEGYTVSFGGDKHVLE